MQHKYAKVIKAWADGEQIEMRCPTNKDCKWEVVEQPKWELSNIFEFRVKKNYLEFMPVERCIKFEYETGGLDYVVCPKENNIRFIFDTNTCELVDVELI